jgi:hypothetical protein
MRPEGRNSDLGLKQKGLRSVLLLNNPPDRRHADMPTCCTTWQLLHTLNILDEWSQLLLINTMSDAKHRRYVSDGGLCTGRMHDLVRASHISFFRAVPSFLRSSVLYGYRFTAKSQRRRFNQYLLLISGYPQNMTMLLKHAVSQRRRFNIFC